ncbi:cytochrome c oxidase assembly protein [Homoserinimonas hongtaonis]|uniref:cytochrome c oxidase assembly protein n=1 Tax=Homoserinimonas hongtaonis TaxID=2079791 RepID=UPI000D3DB036|nr:cytochrome c oxidase assembly protein [Salinibacterium hongtaonis]AWB90357.1 hypothetical protein C2138_13055 [Salinibacterium hongtaonis]
MTVRPVLVVYNTHEHHGSGAPGAWLVDVVLLWPFLFAAAAYLVATAIQARRGRRWPWFRSLFWVAGMAAAACGFVGPIASWSHTSFTGHMLAHLLVGMVAPLFLVLAAPVTLALRTLSVVPARRLSRLLNSAPARTVTNPVVAALLNVGGMWVVYRTPLFDAMQSNALLHLLVMAHFLAAGVLYTASLVLVDPSPHRASFPLRATVLVLSLAAHGVLAKLLYAYPPPEFSAADVQLGAQLMYYGGDAVDFFLIVLLCAELYRRTGHELRRTNPETFHPAGALSADHR